MNGTTVHLVLLVVAIILFVLAAIPVGNGRLMPAGLAFLAASFLF
jgi:hypothetical protein